MSAKLGEQTRDGRAMRFSDVAARRVLSAEALEGLGLTAREAQVLVAIARGRSTTQTAAELAISARTVHKHLQRIHAKLGVSGRAQAIATAWAAAEAAGVTG